MDTEKDKKITAVQPVVETRDQIKAALHRKRTPEEMAKFERSVAETVQQYDQALRNLA